MDKLPYVCGDQQETGESEEAGEPETAEEKFERRLGKELKVYTNKWLSVVWTSLILVGVILMLPFTDLFVDTPAIEKLYPYNNDIVFASGLFLMTLLLILAIIVPKRIDRKRKELLKKMEMGI